MINQSVNQRCLNSAFGIRNSECLTVLVLCLMLHQRALQRIPELRTRFGSSFTEVFQRAIEIYEDVTIDDINFAAEGMLQFLATLRPVRMLCSYCSVSATTEFILRAQTKKNQANVWHN